MNGRARCRCARQRQPARKPVLRGEWLEERAMMSGTQGPAVAAPISVTGGTTVTGKSASLSVAGSDPSAPAGLVYDWSISSLPAGGSVSFSANGSNAAEHTTLTFAKAGTYGVSVKIVDSHGLSVTNSLKITVAATFTSIKITTPSSAVASTTSPLNVTTTSQTLTAQALDQFGNVLAVQPTFKWSTSSLPGSAPTPSLSVSGSSAAFTYGKAGSYTESVQATTSGVSHSAQAAINVISTPTYITVSRVGSTSSVAGTTAQFTVSGFQDQFHTALSGTTKVAWAATTLPNGASAPAFSTSGTTTTVTFDAAGQYTLKATESNTAGQSVSQAVTVIVAQTATSIVVIPGTSSLAEGATQQFTAQVFDQFKHALQTQPAVTWSSSGGTITTAGLFTAPGTAASDTITAKSGSLSGTATVTIQTATLPLQNAYLQQLVSSLDTSGSITREDMLQIFSAVEAKGAITSSELADLQQIVSDAATLNMAGYVQQLASDVINGNTANATYQGTTLGNLAVGSSATQLTDLVDKWFLGTDLPTLTSSSYVYKTVSGSLFPTTPSVANEYQGELGDCYFISSLGTIADQNPAAIEDMFINNGDGTYTVRFYTGNYGSSYNASNGSYSDGFTNGTGTPQYVTVNLQLPTTTTGMLVYADYGAMYNNSGNSLWIPLLEKAYAEWNQTGAEGRDGTNSYAGIEGGWMATVDAQVLGHNATDYFMGTATEQQLISGVTSGQAVTIATLNTEYGLYGDHAYAVTAYNASTNTFTLYNPWGFDQPGQLTWSQLESDCDGFVVANAAGATPISSAAVKSGIASVVSSQFPATAPAAISAAASTAATSAPQNSSAAVDALFAGDELIVGGESHDFGQWSEVSGNQASVTARNSAAIRTGSPSATDLAFGEGTSAYSGAESLFATPGVDGLNVAVAGVYQERR